MLVSHLRRFIYVKGSKVGGTSTEVFFQPACQDPDFPIRRVTPSYVGPEGIVGARATLEPDGSTPFFTEHMLVNEIKKCLGEEIWTNYFVFSNIRNPFTAEISRAKHRARARGRVLKDRNELMEDITQHVEDSNARGRQFLNRQSECNINAVVRFECLENDILRVAEKVRYKSQSSVQHLQRSPGAEDRVPPEDLWTTEARDRLVRKRESYFEAFGYSTDPREAYDIPPLPKISAERRAMNLERRAS